jgi:PTS system nitrogen regulatory IIA component
MASKGVPMKNILTINELAEKLKMSVSTLYKYAEKGKIPSIKIGTCRRFIEEEIYEFINRCQENKTIDT